MFTLVSGSRALGLTEDVWHQKYENQKEGFENYLKYSFNTFWGTEPRIRFLAKTGSSSQQNSDIFMIIYNVLIAALSGGGGGRAGGALVGDGDGTL
mgnify:CR=1 FL=1